MIIKSCYFSMYLLCSFFIGYGQTILSSGDIAIIGMDTLSEDFMFVTFVPLNAGTQIYFTDEEATGIYVLGEGEGTVLYTTPAGGVDAGTVISYKTSTSDFSTTSDGDIALSDSGDGIIAYQGTSVGNVTTFLHAVGETILDIGTFPDGFSNYVLINGDDGEYYNIRSGGTAATYLAAINNSSNWSTSGGGISPFNYTFFTFGVEQRVGCNSLLISEYIEGSSYNKYIEIYNPTNAKITLTNNYSIQIYKNGSNSFTNISLTGAIEPYDVFVIANNQATLIASVQQTSSSLDFNGNDAVALANSETIIDLVGVIGDTSDFAANVGLKRKNSIQKPTVNYDDSEWDILSTDDVSNLEDHLGDCSLLCLPIEVTTWDGTTWSSGNPNNTKVAFISGDYNTLNNGSFQACSLVVNSGVTFTIANTTFIEVENNIFINGTILVESQGSFVQNNDEGIFKVNSEGMAFVQKTTAPVNAWYEYTYWSSPVANETIGVALANAPENRRFWYNAQNYLDATAETDNDNATVSGQDDIDDNGNDWQVCLPTDVMLPGVGYAATQSPQLFTGLGSQYQYTFKGAYNNGFLEVPVYRNDSELLDTNWNFIGNPYPSAIAIDAFFNENVHVLNANGVLDGAIYLWSQNTPPSNITNGNESLNFSQSDYVIINGIGSTAAQNPGGDGEIPERFIPSCQGFFASFSNDAVASVFSGNIKKGIVFFNNAMRVTGNNTQFFKNSSQSKFKNSENKIWVDLTSNNGVYNQILVGYVAGATDGFDASFYDATRNLSSGVSSIIYSLIEGNNQKLAIQGKSISSLKMEEIIPIGFYTSIKNSTTYKLGISKIEGNFFNENTVYLEDVLLGVTHNLSASSYSFTSESGEFNNRFKIVFNNKTLAIENNVLNANNVTISALDDGNIQVSTNTNFTIRKVQIIDFLGRIMFDFKGTNTCEVYPINNLNSSIYFVKVTLSNGQVIVKKAIKKNQ